MQTVKKKFTLCLAISLTAVAMFWWGYRVRNFPKTQITSAYGVRYLGPKESLELYEKLVTPGPDGMAYSSLRSEYDKAKNDWQQKSLASGILNLLGLSLLVCSGAMIMPRTRQHAVAANDRPTDEIRHIERLIASQE